jgi:hypothetical protein
MVLFWYSWYELNSIPAGMSHSDYRMAMCHIDSLDEVALIGRWLNDHILPCWRENKSKAGMTAALS